MQLGPVSSTTRTTMSGDFQSTYTIRIEGKTDGMPLPNVPKGPQDMLMVQTARWTGASCPEGMKPGDFTLPGGMRFNIKQARSCRRCCRTSRSAEVDARATLTAKGRRIAFSLRSEPDHCYGLRRGCAGDRPQCDVHQGIANLVSLVVLTLAGASAGMAQGTATPARLTGGEWVVQSIGGLSVGGDRSARIAIAADRR
jgi:hypothetical protein